MKKRLVASAAMALALATLANAAYSNYGTFSSDGYLTGFANTNTQGYITINWTGYASPYTPGRAGFRLKVWSTFSGYMTPWYTESFGAYGTSTNYSRQVNVPAGYYTNVELYATGNQYYNSPGLSWCYVTYCWIHNQ